MTAVTWAVIALLIVLNGLYVSAEFAAVSVRRSRVRQLAEDGNRFARSLVPTLEEGRSLDRYIAACQVGITVSSLVLGAYGQASMGRAFTPLFVDFGGMQQVAAQSASAAVVLVGLTTLQMVLGELVPKSLALQYPTRIALLTVLPMRWSERMLSWFVSVLNGSGWLVLRAFRIEPKPHRHLHSAEEIRFLLAESRKGGHLRPEELRRLNEALGLTRRTARELMVPRTRVVAVEEAGGLAAGVDVAAASPFTRFPVYRESMDRVVGFVHAKDLARAWFRGAPPDAPLAPMIRPMLVVHERVSADRVLSLMRKRRGVMAVVVDDHGGTSGVVTTEDILDEILGGVSDEFKGRAGRPERLDESRIRLPGDLPLYETGSWIGVVWNGEADTVAGLIMERLGRIPSEGDVLRIEGMEVEVETVAQHTARTVVVRVAEPVEGQQEETASDAGEEGAR